MDAKQKCYSVGKCWEPEIEPISWQLPENITLQKHHHLYFTSCHLCTKSFDILIYFNAHVFRFERRRVDDRKRRSG